jgi:hypothetical protein
VTPGKCAKRARHGYHNGRPVAAFGGRHPPSSCQI